MEFWPKLVAYGNKRNLGKVTKSNSIIYHCFICSFVEHKTYDYLHKNVVHAMLREKAMAITPKKRHRCQHGLSSYHLRMLDTRECGIQRKIITQE
jgi:hypothetical protein